MRILLLFILTCILFSACEKVEYAPVPLQQHGVTYKVECNECVVYFEDNNYNRVNPFRDQITQHSLIQGSWSYNFDPKDLEYLYLEVYVSTFSPQQHIKASISIDGEIVSSFTGDLGIPRQPGEYETSKILELKLNNQ